MSRRYDLTESTYDAAFTAFKAAVARAPGQTAFANICRCTQGNISQLIRNRSLLPERFVLKVEAATGIPKEHLRPDIYPAGPSAPLSDGSVNSGGPVVACDRPVFSQRGAA